MRDERPETRERRERERRKHLRERGKRPSTRVRIGLGPKPCTQQCAARTLARHKGTTATSIIGRTNRLALLLRFGRRQSSSKVVLVECGILGGRGGSGRKGRRRAVERGGPASELLRLPKANISWLSPLGAHGGVRGRRWTDGGPYNVRGERTGHRAGGRTICILPSLVRLALPMPPMAKK
jgi:hypothetical protein